MSLIRQVFGIKHWIPELKRWAIWRFYKEPMLLRTLTELKRQYSLGQLLAMRIRFVRLGSVMERVDGLWAPVPKWVTTWKLRDEIRDSLFSCRPRNYQRLAAHGRKRRAKK